MKNQAQTIRFGIYTFSSIALLFLIMKLFGLEHISILRLLNIVIVVHFTNRLARIYNMRVFENDYFGAISSLFMMNVMAVVLSVISLIIYVKGIDPELIHHFRGGLLWSNKITLSQACLALLFEGIASSAIISFIVMQYWKTETSFIRTPRNKEASNAK